MATAAEWSVAYARQAAADLATWDILQKVESVPRCHKLLFLQMTCEKLCKAHLCSRGIDPQHLQASHAFTSKNLLTVIRQQVGISMPKPKQVAWVNELARHLAREIEMLAPAVRRGGQRPDNCEYPWEDDTGAIHSPLDWTFAPSGLLETPAGRIFLKLVRAAISRLLA